MLINKLTRHKITALPDGLHSDGANLYLRKRGTAMSWVFRYMKNKRVRELGLGSVRDLSLADARKKAADLRKKIMDGVELSVARKQFQITGYIEWSVERSNARDKPNRLKKLTHVHKKYVSGLLATLPIETVTPEDFAYHINKINLSATTMFWIISGYKNALLYAKMHGVKVGSIEGFEVYQTNTNKKVEHRKALHWKEAPMLYHKIAEADINPQHKNCILWLMLTASRRVEPFSVRLEDIDLDNRIVTYPITKNGHPHLVPYPTQLNEVVNGTLVQLAKTRAFTVKAVYVSWVKATEGLEVTLHGLRSMFSTWAADNGKSYEVREACLNHTYKSSVEAAYQRSSLLERRRELLQEWADFVTGA